MFALAAAFVFLLALILHLLSVRGDIVLDLVIGGALGVALHLAFGFPWRRGA